MRYMGGKAKIARHIVGAILQDTDARDVWYEPFVGGGNVMEHAAPHFARCAGTDIHPDLIMMWRHVTAGGRVPEFVTREEYAALRHAEPSWLRGYVGFGASFGGKWFGGYGDKTPTRGEVCRESYRAVSRQAEVFRTYGVKFSCGPFGRFVPPPGAVVYCDPPYAGTTAYNSVGPFDYRMFYDTLTEWADTRSVYVSEYGIPEDVPSELVWEKNWFSTLKRAGASEVRVERLFRILPGARMSSYR
jgi:DNA adenine methylase